MKYIIIVDKQPKTNPSDEKKQYEIDIEELRVKGDIYDSLVITKNEDYVMRRLSLSEFHVLSVLDEPVKEPLTELNIELFEGDNYIYLLDEIGNKIYAEYLIKNDFNDIYVTNNQMNSAINQNAQQIELTVNQKLTSYATNEEVENNVTELNSKITQTATEITSEVSKKVGNDEIISKINQSAEQVGIDANKIELSANDVLNLLAGNAINLTSRNIIISSDKFSVDKNGNLICNNANIKNASIDGGNLKMWGNDALDGVRVFKDSSKNTGYMAYMVCDSIGVNKGNDNAGMTPTAITIGNSTMYKDHITTPTLNQTSLKTRKKNIKKLNVNALDLIKNSDICLYNLKGEKAKSKKHIGLVIGEGYNCPEQVVSEDRQGVEQYSMTSLAWKAIQELIQENNNLKQRIEKLEVQNGNN